MAPTTTVRLKDPRSSVTNESLGLDLSGTQTATVEETPAITEAIQKKILVRVKDAAVAEVADAALVEKKTPARADAPNAPAEGGGEQAETEGKTVTGNRAGNRRSQMNTGK